MLIVIVSHAGLGHIIPGGLGVTTFFFLSGFLITTLLLREYDDKNDINFSHFYLRRFFRLFPPLIIILSLSYFLCLIGFVSGEASWQGFLAQIFYFANYHQLYNWPGGTPMGTGILWSLAVEEHFYLLFPIAMYILLKYAPRQRLPLVFILLSALVLIWRVYLAGFSEVDTNRIYYATDTRIDSILFGCLLAVSFNPIYSKASKVIPTFSWLILICAVGLLISTLVYRDPLFRDTLRFSLQGIALMPIFYLSIRHSKHPIFNWLNTAIIRKIGVYSYVIYLSHHIIIGVLTTRYNLDNPVLIIIIAGSISTPMAFLVDRYVDRYFRGLRKKFR